MSVNQLSPLELVEKLAVFVPLPRVHLVRYAGCLAPHSTLREAIIPTPRQQGVDGEDTQTGTPYWDWARLLGRVFALAMATCVPPLCGRREARRRAAPTQSRQAWRPVFRHCVGGGSLATFRCAGVTRGASWPRSPMVGDHAHPASWQAGVRATPPCPCPLSPRALGVRRGPLQRGPRGAVRAAAVSFAPSRRCNAV